MDSASDNWLDELEIFYRSVENCMEITWKRVKNERIRNNLPFDDSFKKYFLERTNFR